MRNRMRYGWLLAGLCLGVTAADHFPLLIGTEFEALPPGMAVELDEATLPLAALRENSGVDWVVAKRGADGGWQPATQWRSPEGNWFFELPEGLAPYCRSLDYEVVAAPAVAPPPLLAGMRRIAAEPTARWRDENNTAAELQYEAADGGMTLRYRGATPHSRVTVIAPELAVEPGSTVQLNAVWQLLAAPPITVAGLPGVNPDGSWPGPHEVENQLTGFLSNLRFYDGDGRVVPGPEAWELHRVAAAYPRRRTVTVTVPETAVRVAFTFEFQGAGEVALAVFDRHAVQLPPGFEPRAYDVAVAGKVTFPQREMRLAGADFSFGAAGEVTLGAAAAALALPEAVLLDGLRDWAPRRGDGGAIRLGLTADAAWLDEWTAAAPDTWGAAARDLPPEGYLLRITADGALVLGRDQRGLFYGVQELGERLRLGAGTAAPALVLDYPAQELRIVHQLLTWNNPTDPKAYYEKWLPELARHRINMFAFDARRDWFRLAEPERRAYWQWLAELCRRWQIMPLPMGMNFRNLQPVEAGLEWTAAKWTADEPYRLTGTDEVKLKGHADGYYVRSGDDSGFGFAALPDGTRPTLALTGGDNPFLVTSADGATRYERGRDYVIESAYRYVEGSNGYTLPGNSLTLKWATGVRRTPESRIPDGATVLISYNYLYRQRGRQNEHFSSCISETAAIDAACAAMRDMIETVRPEWVHINQDEIVGVGRDGRDIMQLRANGGQPGRLFANLLERLKRTARAGGVKNPLIAWSDNFTPTHAGWSQNYNGPFYLYGVREFIDPADYLIDVWGGVGTAEELLQNGYAILVAPLEDKTAIVESAQYLADRKLSCGADRVRGIQLSCWRAPDEANFLHLRDFARLGWNPGPWGWTAADGTVRQVYDFYGVPTTVERDGAAYPLHAAAPEPGVWPLWQAGWVRALPEAVTGPDWQLRNERGYRKALLP